jgi:hypothetical protein
MLAKATAAFGDVPVRRLLPDEIGRWAKRLPDGHRHDAMVALRQVLNAAVRWKVIEENPARLVPNPLPRREEIRPFETWAEVEAVAEELGPYGPLVVLRPGPASGRKRGSRSSAVTSTAWAASFTSAERTQAATFGTTARRSDREGAFRFASASSTLLTLSRRVSTRRSSSRRYAAGT